MMEQPKMIYSKCRICKDEAEHKAYQVKEMFFGTGKEFMYFECDKCQCIQIVEVPENLGEYYGSDYYSFEKPKLQEPETPKRIERRILDVGCGAGKWLIEKYAEGHVNLWGCDPFLEQDISYGECIHIKKCTIHEIEGQFDLIRLHDSFEHMVDPLETLISIERLLDEAGMCLLSIPVFPNAAYDIFGTFWYQWDAPRHLFLHSVKSMKYLCSQTGLQIREITFNSGDMQFISSLLYQEGIPYIEHDDVVIEREFSNQELIEFAKVTEELNRKGYGDHAVFVLVKDRGNIS